MWQHANDAYTVLHTCYYATATFIFGERWHRLKDLIHDFCAEHLSVHIVLLVLLELSVLILCYPSGVFFWLWAICESMAAKYNEPRRSLLKEKEITARRAKREERDATKMLSVIRPRALTLRSDPKNDGGAAKEFRQDDKKRPNQRILDQLETCELWRFPFEVRELIWKYAVGGNHIHIVRRRGRLGSVYCPAKDPIDPVHRDLCTRDDRQGYYVPTAWPRDTRPLALLVSCRQIYSECINYLYSHNTFTFQDPSLVPTFLDSLLPPRRQHVVSFHLETALAPWESNGDPYRYIQRRQKNDYIELNLGRVLEVLANQPTLFSVTFKPDLGWDFRSSAFIYSPSFVPIFTHALNKLKTSKRTVLVWPEDPSTYIDRSIIHDLKFWGGNEHLPDETSRTFELRRIPWQSPAILITFFIPFDVQCLHCRRYTLIRRTTKGFAEVSFHTLDLSSPPPGTRCTVSEVLTRYWTFHSFCGGWIEFQYHGARKEWSVTQGARRISKQEAERHLAGLEHRGERASYPEMGSPHERLTGVLEIDVVAKTSLERWGPSHWDLVSSRGIIDSATKDAYYRNVGWRVEK